MGYLIAIEGIDGAGKTTIAKFLKEKLEEFGIDTIILKEPSESEYGRKIKSSNVRLKPEEELELFILDRKYNVENNILPALEKCVTVIMDRYYYSNVAYQGARGISPDFILEKNEEIAPKPDLTIILDINPETAIERVKYRGKRSVFEELEYLRKVRNIYLSLKSNEIVFVDANQKIEDVKEECLYHVLSLLSSRGSFLELKLRRF